MEIDFAFIWDTMPRYIAGRVCQRNYNGSVLIEPLVDLREPNGEVIPRVFYAKPSELQTDDFVLFTINKESQEQCEQRHALSKDRQIYFVKDASPEDIKTHQEAFKGVDVEKALEQLSNAKLEAESAGRKAGEKKTEYEERLNEINSEINRGVEEQTEAIVADVTKREEVVSVRENALIQREAMIAPYRRWITLPPATDATTEDLSLPKDLAKKWPDLLRDNGLTISNEIATAFLLCTASALHSGSIVLLNGSVGVGKTRLVQEAANVLVGKADFIPVRPAWIDPSDLLGYFDPIKETFRPTPFTTALRDTTNENRFHFLCLDELNLAKIENYAADLLSSMEYSRPLNLYSEDIEKQLLEEGIDIENLGENATAEEKRKRRAIAHLVSTYPACLEYPPNKVLVGTLNSDETTYDLSPKMIDRSYAITIPPVNINENPQSINEGQAREAQITIKNLRESIKKALETSVKEWKTVAEWNNKLNLFGIPMGYRVKRDYDVFRAAGLVLGVSEQDCVGYFLFCKILPRIFFFKGPNENKSGTLQEECKAWLDALSKDYGKSGPADVIKNLIKMCDDDQSAVVRYWSK